MVPYPLPQPLCNGSIYGVRILVVAEVYQTVKDDGGDVIGLFPRETGQQVLEGGCPALGDRPRLAGREGVDDAADFLVQGVTSASVRFLAC